MSTITVQHPRLVTLFPAGVATLVLIAVWLMGSAANPGPLGFRLDDAWIHMVYGRSLATEGVLAYNPGIPSTGATSPLWALILGAVHAILEDRSITTLVSAVLGLGACLQVALVHSSSRLIGDLTANPKAAIVGGVALALSPHAAAAALSGMEVTLTALCVVLGLRYFLQRRMPAAGLLFALAAAARPEAAVVGVVAFATWAIDASGTARSTPRGTARSTAMEAASLVIPSVVIGGAILGWNLWASGQPLPASFYVKEETDLLAVFPRFLNGGWDIVGGFSPLAGGLTLLLLGGLFLRPEQGASRGQRALPLAASLALIGANLLTVKPIDPDSWYHIRYLLPALPLLVIAVSTGVTTLDQARVGATRWGLVGLALVSLIHSAFTLQPVSQHLHNDTRNINEVQREIGDWIAETLPPGAWIASADAGAIRYFSDHPTIDLMSLNTPQLKPGGTPWTNAHPVVLLVLLPSWFQPANLGLAEVVHRAETADYSVTSNPAMAQQVVLACRGPIGKIVAIALGGIRPAGLACVASAPLPRSGDPEAEAKQPDRPAH